MKIYWSLYSVPEFIGVPKSQHGQIWLRALRRVYLDGRLWAFLFPGLSVSVAAAYFGGFLGALASCLTVGWVGGQILVRLSRPHIKRLAEGASERQDVVG